MNKVDIAEVHVVSNSLFLIGSNPPCIVLAYHVLVMPCTTFAHVNMSLGKGSRQKNVRVCSLFALFLSLLPGRKNLTHRKAGEHKNY